MDVEKRGAGRWPTNGGGAAAGAGAIYGLGIFGAWAYFFSHACGFWEELLARFFLVGRPVAVEWVYDGRGPLSRHGGFAVPGVVAWAAGGMLYYFRGDLGGTLPALAGSALTYWLVDKLTAGPA